MNILSKKVLYALKTILFLASQGPKVRKPVSDIAGTLDMPLKYLEMVCTQLKKEGVLQSQRGVQGGYFLKVQLKEITLLDLLELFDGPFQLCELAVLSTSLASFMDGKNLALRDELSITLDELHAVQQKGHSVLSYVI